MQKYQKPTERGWGFESHGQFACAMSNPHGMKVFFQARVLRLCPRSPWQVGPVQRMWWRTQKLNHAAHKQLPPWKRGRRNFLHPPRVLQSALSGPSEMWDGAYFNRNPPVTQTHKHQLAVLHHDYVTRQDQQRPVMPSTFAEEQTGPRFRFVLRLVRQTHTHLFCALHYSTCEEGRLQLFPNTLTCLNPSQP